MTYVTTTTRTAGDHQPTLFDPCTITTAERAAIIDRWQGAMRWVARMQAKVSYYETNSGRGPLGIQPAVEAEARTAADDSAPGVAA